MLSCFLSFCLHCSSYLCLFFFFFFFSPLLSPHFAITASHLLGGSLHSACPVCSRPSTSPPSGNCSLPFFCLLLHFHLWPPSPLLSLSQFAGIDFLKLVQTTNFHTFWHHDSIQCCFCIICWLAHCTSILVSRGYYFTLWYKRFRPEDGYHSLFFSLFH